MRAFWQFLLRRDLPAQSLAALEHACFGLGDSSYPKFCFVAKRLHRRLEQLGSSALLPIGLGDDQDALGVDHALGPWSEQLWSLLDARMPLPAGLSIPPASERPPPRYSVEMLPHRDEASAMVVDVSDVGAAGAPDAAGAPAPPASKRCPHAAVVRANRLLTAEGIGREVRHLEIDVTGWGRTYAPGDALAVQPVNPEGQTRALLARLGLDADAAVRIAPAQPHAPPLAWAAAAPHGVSVYELFARRLDVFGVARRPFFALLAHYARDAEQAERCLLYTSPSPRDS